MNRLVTGTAVAALMVGVAATADARITALEIEKTEPFAAGTSFGAAGEYVRITGRAKGELDPALPVNKGIVNLDKAPRNARGMVEYETDFFILRPADPAKGNRKMIYEVNNRGRKFFNVWIMDAAPVAGGAINDPRTADHAGNGLFLRQGYTIAWSGWDADAPRAGNGLAMTVPVATNNGQPIVRMIRDELVSGTRAPEVEQFRLSYEAATLDQSRATLTVRRKEAYAKAEIPASGWAYVNSRTIKLLPEGTKPQPGALYELTIRPRTRRCSASAMPRRATSSRSCAMRSATIPARPIPPAGRSRTYSRSASRRAGATCATTSARASTRTKSKRKVFDGVLAHISGIGRVFHNDEFGQPFRTNTQHEDHTYPENEFPFAAAQLKDPLTGAQRLDLLRGDGFDPLLIETNTSTEYWQKGASLLHTDPLGRATWRCRANARVYLVAGTQHGGRAGLQRDARPVRQPAQPAQSDAGPARADRGARRVGGRRQGAAREPRADASRPAPLVTADKTGFPAIPGMVATRETNGLALLRRLGRTRSRMRRRAYRPLVPQVDADGNETAGIRLPDIAAPLGTYTGWNLYKAPFPEGELCDRDGSFIAFAQTRAERAAKNDPRPSLEDLYGDHAGYVRKVEAAAQALVRQRLLLQEDADRYLERARRTDPFKS